MKDKKIIITGGSSGMGKAAVSAALNEGCRVLFTARKKDDRVDQILDDLKMYVLAGKLFFLACDSSKEEDVLRLPDYAKETIGGCDALLNFAGVYKGGAIHTNTVSDYEFNFDTNVKGTFLTCRAVLPMMMEQRSGAIVNVASLSGLRGDYNASLYAAAKAAVINLTKSMAMDYAEYGIRVNVIAPSATATPMFLNGTIDAVMNAFLNANPYGRIGTPEEIADVALFLSSDKARYVNGQCLSVDGGLSSWCGQPRQDKTAK